MVCSTVLNMKFETFSDDKDLGCNLIAQPNTNIY